MYAAVGLQRSPPAGSGRGAEDGVCSIPAVWADVDIAGPAHSSEGTAADRTGCFRAHRGRWPAALDHRAQWLRAAGLLAIQRTVADRVGRDRAAAKSLSTRFQAVLRQMAQSRGWRLDSTPDLCRVLRVPGTFNRKLQAGYPAGDRRVPRWAYNPGRSRRDPRGHRDAGDSLPRPEMQDLDFRRPSFP